MPLPEKSLIAEIRRIAPGSGKQRAGESARATRIRATRVRTGIGDDCAVLRFAPGRDSLVTTDFSLEGIHFRREWHPARSVGHRCLARGLSDIAAMGGEPVAAFLSLAVPRDLPQVWVREFIRGLNRLAEEYGVVLAGGDTAESPGGILADIVAVGSVPKGKSVMRSGARVGDRIYVTGELGGSAAAIGQMRRIDKRVEPRQYRRHFFPEPRVEVGRALREKRMATAMIDLSDGLSTDLAHICEESGVGAEIEVESIPRARVGKPARKVDLELALHSGEDYELLFTAAASRRIPPRIAGVKVTCIGRIVAGRARVMGRRQAGRFEIKARGWEHFRS